jgi:hypothetical protein
MSASDVGQEPRDSGYISVMIPYAVYRKFAWYLAAVKSPTRVEEAGHGGSSESVVDCSSAE